MLQPEEALHAARYRQIAQLVACGSEFVWGTVIQERTWLDEVIQSLNQVARMLQHDVYGSIPDDDSGRFSWFRQASHEHASHDYKLRLSRYCKECLADSRMIAEKAAAKARMIRDLEQKGALVLSINPDLDEKQLPEHLCEVCGDLFLDGRALAAHRSLSHGLIADASTAAVGTACECCRLQFWIAYVGISTGQRHAWLCTLRRTLMHPKTPCAPLVGPTPFWAMQRPSQPCAERGVGYAVQHESFGVRLSRVQNAGDAQKLLQWWHRSVQHHTEAEISSSIEDVAIGDVVGLRHLTLAIACQVARLEAGNIDDALPKVITKGSLYFGIPSCAFHTFTDEQKAYILQ